MKQKHSIVSGHQVTEDEYYQDFQKLPSETESQKQEREIKRQKVIYGDNYDAFLEGRESNF